MAAAPHHISVCICTYKRPELLNRLLSTLEKQNTDDIFNFSIVVVDNDNYESDRQVVESYAAKSKLSINYYVQPEQNIALTRNKAIEQAKGAFVGLIVSMMMSFPIRIGFAIFIGPLIITNQMEYSALCFLILTIRPLSGY